MAKINWDSEINKLIGNRAKELHRSEKKYENWNVCLSQAASEAKEAVNKASAKYKVRGN